MTFQVTRFIKSDGPLTKRIAIAPDGTVASDGSACLMSRGAAQRVQVGSIQQLSTLIGRLQSNEAIALGALRPDLPDEVEITTKRRLNHLNGAKHFGIIVRTSDYIIYRRGENAFALLDFDTKGMSPDVSARLHELGGYWPALTLVLPELGVTARVERSSTSAGLFRSDTGDELPGSNGAHVFIAVRDGEDIDRFLKTLHARCRLAGLGWLMVGAGGQLLERSIVDRMVGAPERLVFEGAPVLLPPLAQDEVKRRPMAMDGSLLDTITACPPLTILEQSKLRELRAREEHFLSAERVSARDAFLAEHAERLIDRARLTREQAVQVVARQCAGVLLSAVVLPFDDPELADVTVADVLADPARFEGATLADPLEGIGYGGCKAKVMRRADGAPWIHSFAHGRTIYQLRHDARAIEAALEKVEKGQAADTFVGMVLAGDLTPDETEALKSLAANRSGVGKRALDAKLKWARQELKQQQTEEDRQRQTAARRDPRPQIPAPAADAPWLPEMQVLNDVLGTSREPEPPMRDIDGIMTQVRVRRATNLHTLTAHGANESEIEESRLPAPEQPLLTRLDEAQLAELIEKYIDYVDGSGRSVHLAAPFVKHYLTRHDDVLPLVSSVATLPMVLPDGKIFSGKGLMRGHSIVFRVPPELETLLPRVQDCTSSAVAVQMQFLTDDWLCDVAADYPGKCVIIAAALTILERLLLPERPAFFITAGQRGGGKTTTANMIALATLGRRAAAAAWSPSDEERRKALLAYLAEGVPFIVWDNIPRGEIISCPSIERALTTETYSDRVLGVSYTRTVPASAVQAFTGNNIAPRGDLASRSLTTRIAVERPDPENRAFKHPDPIAWTEAHRGRILQALYTVLRGNPRLYASNPSPPETRFKMWWHLIGSAVEHAAELHAAHVPERVVDRVPAFSSEQISFRKLFLSGEADDEQTCALVTVLEVLRGKWPNGCKASDVAYYAGAADDGAIAFKSAIEQASRKPLKVITATAVTWRLKALADAPVSVGHEVLALSYIAENRGGMFAVRVTR